MKKDIDSREDIVRLVDTFYKKVQADSTLAPLFVHVNWESHLPIMHNFWSTMMLGDQSYRGNPFERHKALPLEATHFQRWIALFTDTVDEHFVGPGAEQIKQRALAIAGVFQHKLNLIPTR